MCKFDSNIPIKRFTDVFFGPAIPQFPETPWVPLSKVKGIEQCETCFIIHTAAGERQEDLFLSLPAEGGVRIQSLHAAQKEKGCTMPEENNAGVHKPSALVAINYQQDGDVLLMTGGDGTVVRYMPTAEGFILQFAGGNGDVVSITEKQICYTYDHKGNVAAVAVQMPITENEAFTGGGERFNDTNQVGHSFSLVNVDSPSVNEYTYVNVPLFHSNKGYSVWFNMNGVGQADFGEADPEKYFVLYKQPHLDLFLWAGTPLENLKKYTDITGTSGVCETWAYGFWTGAASWAFNETKKKDAFENLKELLEGYKENYNFYPEGCYGEGKNSLNAEPIKYAADRGIKMFYWFFPAVYDMPKKAPDMPEFPTYDQNGNMVNAGWPYPLDEAYLNNFGAHAHYFNDWYDFSNPNSKEVIRATLTPLWDIGVKGAMLDYGERLPFGGLFHNHVPADEMHNFNSYYYAKHHYEEWTRRHGNEYVLFQRSGTAGTQYFVGNFLGDQYSNWEGFIKQVYSLVNMGASGYNQYGGDLGALLEMPTANVWNRWVALVPFMPFMRQHGCNIHHPWSDFDGMAKAAFGHYYYFRKNIVPTVVSASIDANKTSNPIVKGMIMAYPKQLPLKDVNTQYLFCDDFLVCAVTRADVCFEQVILPKGSTWYDLYSYKAYKGGQVMDAEAPTSTMPVFVKGGAVKAIDLPESLELGDEMHDDTAIPALLITAPDTARTHTIHVKDGKSVDYRTYNSHMEVYDNTPGVNATFTVGNTQGSPRQLVMLLGVTAAAVTVDGEPLSCLDHTPVVADNEYGYYVDRKGKTVMVLPVGWKELSVVKGESSYQPLPLYGDEEVAAMFDGTPATNCVLPEGDGAFVEAALTAVTKIDRIVVKWATGFCSDYDVRYSADGQNWKTVEQRGRCGSVNTLDIAPADAKYLRIYPLKKGDNEPAPAVYALEVYAAQTAASLPVKQEDVIDWSVETWQDDEWKAWRPKVITKSGK